LRTSHRCKADAISLTVAREDFAPDRSAAVMSAFVACEDLLAAEELQSATIKLVCLKNPTRYLSPVGELRGRRRRILGGRFLHARQRFLEGSSQEQRPGAINIERPRSY
jgi:hypothetical protein